MKFHKMPPKHQTKGLCWKYALACILNVNPSKVPDLMRDDIEDGMAATRKWLQKKFNKGIVYVPLSCFLETGEEKENPCGGPDGYTIMVLKTTEEDVEHAVIAKDGKFCHDPNDVPHREREFTHLAGFCIIYDL
jgi:hypothetical protein